MARTGNRQRRTRAQWQALVAAYEASCESQRAYCAAHGVALSTLRHWKDRLAGAARKAAPAVARLVAIDGIEEPAAGSGVRIEVAAGFDGATIKRVLATLGAGA